MSTVKRYTWKNNVPADKSVVPAGNNNSSAKESFVQRGVYEAAFPEQGPIPLDTHEGYNFLWGRVDTRIRPVMLLEDNLKQLPAPGDGPAADKTFWALNFVVDAFKDLQSYMSRSAKAGRIVVDSSVYVDIVPANAWSTESSIHFLYNNYFDWHFGNFVASYLNSDRHQQINNFDDFVKKFIDYATRICYVSPMTRIGYITSHHVNPLSSGLVIELAAGGDYSDDYGKYIGFIRDPNFNYFRRACERHGFLVDKNAPWRIFADITNPYMQEKMKAYGVDRIDDVFPSYYLKASDYELENLRTRFFYMYQMYLEEFPDVTILTPRSSSTSVVKKNGKLKYKGSTTKLSYKLRAGMTFDEMIATHPTPYWVRMLVYLRACETLKPMTQLEFEKCVATAIDYYTYYGDSVLMEYLDKRFCHLPSETYKKNKIKNLTEEDMCDKLEAVVPRFRSTFRPTFTF